jgi:hypothetical protein
MSGMSENLSSERKMQIAEEMKHAVTMLAGERGWHDTRESWLAGAARKAGISYRQAKAFFYGEASNPSSEAVERVRAALKHTSAGAGLHENEIESLRTLVSQLDLVADRLERLGIGQDARRARGVSGRLRRLADGDR